MVAIARALVWIFGSLSLAVLYCQARSVRLAPALESVLAAYDNALQTVLAAAAWPINALLPQLPAGVGAGTTLLPHWPHVFLVVVAALFPRLDGNAGTAVRWSYALVASVVGLAVTVIVGTVPLLAGATVADFVVLGFVSAAFGASVWEEWSAYPKQGSYTENWADWFFFAALGVGVSGAGLAMLGGLISAATARDAWPVVVVLSFVASVVGHVIDAFRDTSRVGRGLLQAPVAYAVRLALLVGALLLALDMSVAVGGPSEFLLLLGAALAGLFGTVVVSVERAVRGAEAVDQDGVLPPSLGVFLLGAAAILAANHYLLRAGAG